MLYELLGLGIAAAITENIVFCRGLEYGIENQDSKSIQELLRLGGIATLLTVIASGCGWLGRFITENWISLLTWTRPALLIAVYSVAIVLLMIGINICQSQFNVKIIRMATRMVYGFITLGTLFIVGNSTMSFWKSVVYGCGTGVGFLLALLLNYGLQQRMEHSDMPLIFRGMPATLLTLGLISLAMFGLLGHPLVV